MSAASEVLKKYWGYESFRPFQQEVIQSILSAKDTLAVMPTGGGKSLCYQIPSMLNDGLCLVISPLIALMKDQVLNLKRRGIPALSIHAGMNFIEVKKTLQNAAYGNFKFLYVSPERLETDLFLEFLPLIKINLIAVDEAHCISQWGYDFRPPYLRIAAIREELKNVPILAVTASATLQVQKDICEKLLFKKNSSTFQQSFERSNLSYSAFQYSSKQNKLLLIIKKVSGSGIVYCKTRKRTKEIAELLNLNGISADYYHAGLSNEERNKKQEQWVNNQTRIIACTNAFGMGIDKPDVRTVIHYDVPDSLENYYQEAGRAGRDGKKSYAVLLYNETELDELKRQIQKRFPSKEMIQKVYGALCNFLQLASGSGEGLSFDFDINAFVKNFKQDVYIVNSVLKILEQEELITYSEQFFSPSTVEFTIDKYALNLLENSHPQFNDVVKGLLRSYDGIFDFPCAIHEEELAKFIHFTKEKLLHQLRELKSLKIINYTCQKEKPQIYFLQNRVKAEDLFINEKNILKRKQAYERRLNAMLHFCLNQQECRSKMIGNYFNDRNLHHCGICDNCLSNKNTILSNKEYTSISNEIKKIIGGKLVSSAELFDLLPFFKQNKIRMVLKFMQEENLISVTENGLIKYKT